jgi:DNA invertase Pin-like site-specific DNA recombinase
MSKAGRVLGYARTSTDDGRQELSLDAQRAALAAAGAVEVFTDEETGKHADRAGLLALLAAARRGDEVLSTKLDRLSRSVADTFRLVEELAARKVQVRTLAEGPCAAATSDQTLSLGLRALFAQTERQKISERTKEGLARKRALGLRVGSVPYGQRLAADGKHLEPEPGEQVVLRLAHQLRGDGLSLREIGWRLVEQGFLTRLGRAWDPCQVRRLVQAVAS